MYCRNMKIRRAVLIALSATLASGNYALAADAAPVDALEEVIVTGSRIRQDTYSSSAPMDILTPTTAMAQGISSVAGLLQSATIAAGSPQVTAASSTAFVENGGIGASTLSLRGLGANRTLTLLNGRRAGPAGTRGGVSSFDLNVIPLGAVERIEILKDGASSVYGSDAVAGVVNIITRKGDGGSVEGFVSRPTDRGGAESRLSATWGQQFDRGNFRVTLDHHREAELAKGDRGYFSCNESYIFNPTTGARRDVIDPRTGKPRCNDLTWGHVWVYDYAADFGDGSSNVPDFPTLTQYDYDGNLGQYIPGYDVDPGNPYWLTTPAGWFPVNYDRASDAVTNADHPFQDAASLIPKTDRDTLFAEGEFEFSDSVTGYSEVLLNRRKTHANGYRQFWGYVYTEDFNFSDYDVIAGSGNPLSAGWSGAQFLSPLSITDHDDDAIDVKYQRVVAGLRGDINESWNWDVSYQFSQSNGSYTFDQIYADAIDDQDFALGSCTGTVTSVRGVPCLNIPWLDPQFLRGNFSPQMQNYLFGSETGQTRYTQWTIEGYVAGELLQLPHGPMSIAVGAQYQYDRIKDTPGEITLADNVWGSTTAGITQGDDHSKALFGELNAPLLADLPAVKALNLNASVRYTDVASYGSDTTYKAGLNWQITPTLRMRVNEGTSFRSPALFELYLANQTSFARQSNIDPCRNWGDALATGGISQRVADNCAAAGLPDDFADAFSSATVEGSGGSGQLKAETSRSRTFGIVWQPAFADLNISADYFDIDIRNEVIQLGAQYIVLGCYDSASFANEPLCDLFERRSSDNGIDDVRDDFMNIARQKNRGWDLAATYRLGIGPGKLIVDTQHTFQLEDTQALFEGTTIDTNGEFGDPRWTGRLSLNYELDPWSFYWGINAIGKVSNEKRYGGNTATYRGETVRMVIGAPTISYHSFSLAREFKNVGVSATFGVANAFNQPPPQVSTLSPSGLDLEFEGRSAFYSQYDWIGRRFF